jgi:radical SAM family uncharacterized protein/radical SAM-linked protein
MDKNNKKIEQVPLSKIEHLLYRVQKPGRYIGGEINSINKNIKGCDVSLALCYPDVYEIGMSNLAIKILYDIVNSQEGMIAERVFSPWTDMEEELKKSKIPYFSLESKTVLTDFDVIGFSIGYELLFTNMLCILDLANIPFRSGLRDETHPLIIAGGPGVVNPEPIADFIDAFVIGEGETCIVDIMKLVRDAKKKNTSRNDLLEQLSQMGSVYVPSKYPIESNNERPPITRYQHKRLENLLTPTKLPIANIKPIQDRGVIEVSRGCTSGCRFCQAGITNRPIRERSVDSIINSVEKLMTESGYYDITLMSLSVADYTNLPILLEKLFERFKDKGISFSLPSLRIDSFTFEIARQLGEVKKTGLTFAVESGNDDMRTMINKNYTEEKLLSFIEKASEYGWNTIKLYFMVGLPLEGAEITEEQAIADLLNKISDKAHKRVKINAHIGIFIPKPHTPYQWVKMIDVESALKKVTFIKQNVKSRRIKIKYVEPEVSVLEGLLSLSGRPMSNVIEKAYQDGARFDGWQEHFSLIRWIRFCQEHHIHIVDLLYTEKPEDYIFPWEHIDVKINKDYLYREYKKSKEKVITKDCREKCFNFCGSCTNGVKRDFDTTHKKIDKEELERIIKKYKGEIPFDEDKKTPEYLLKEPIAKLMLTYEKKGFAKFIGHLDLTYLMLKIIYLTKLPIVFSKGFNPMPKLEFAPPLPIGVEAENDIVEFKIHSKIDFNELKKVLNKHRFEGFKFKKARISKDMTSLGKRFESFEYSIETTYGSEFKTLVDGFEKLMKERYIFVAKDKKKLNNIITYSAEPDNKLVRFTTNYTNQSHLSIMDIVEYVLDCEREEISENLRIVRQNIKLIH